MHPERQQAILEEVAWYQDHEVFRSTMRNSDKIQTIDIITTSQLRMFFNTLHLVRFTPLVSFFTIFFLGGIWKETSSLKWVDTAQKTKFSIKDFLTKYDQIRSFLRIWSHSLKKSLMENFIFCTVWTILKHGQTA